MNQLQIFSNAQFGQVRMLNENGRELFCGSDVAKALGYARPKDAIFAHCKGAVKRRTLTAGGEQEMSFIPEGDVYRLIARSNLPAAVQFEKWLFEEVLPSIRKHGVYAVDELLNDPDFAIKAFTALKEERDRNKALQAQMEHDKPKVLFADAVAASHTSILVGELAKLIKQNGYDIGQNRLFRWLRENGYLIRREGSDYNMPTQRSMEMGLFKIKETAINKPDGSITISKTVKVTGKGQTYFVNLLLREVKKEA